MMGCFSFRSLLVAAIVISNCITWTASRHSYTHNVSGHRRRHRREGKGLALPSHYVLPGGEGSDAGWSQWMAPSNCSRPCGGGVMSQKRVCNLIGSDEKPKCIGGDTKYYSCNTQDCPDPAQDFRAQQCAEYNDVTFKNRTYNWVPYTNGPRPCELNCMPKGERFYYRHRARVIDGTRCNDETFDVCVAGECQPVGCDMMLGSNAREDKCRECRGNGTNCDTISSIYDNKDLTQGYNDILLIPEGATNIIIEELDKSNNYLALRSFDDNEYYLNGGYQISFPHTLTIAGAQWHYERSIQGFAAPDKLRCLGPTTEPLYLSLLQQEENVGIKYEYSIRKGLMPQSNAQYVWAQEEFTPCSVTCGTGFRTRNVTCRVRDSLETADESLCDAVLRPITNETCQLAECLPQWMPSPWGPCTKLCGEGSQSRTVQCQKIISNGYPSIVDEDQCFRRLGEKPAEHQKCNTNATCPTWFTGPWKPCDKLCGDGKQTRQVVCHRRTDGRVEVLVDENCEDEKPVAEQPCNIHPCDGIDWVVSNWTGCDSCLSVNYTREALCVTKDRQVVGKELCSYHPEPELLKKCDKSKLPACESQWYSSQWSECSVDCGVGVKTRKVFCGTLSNGQVEVVDDSKCDAAEKYNDTTPCEVPDELCPAKWFTADWSECTKECDGGLQFRKVMCLSGGNASSSCPESLMPDREQPCNQEACNIDELLSLSSTPVMDDYDDLPLCEEDDEVGSETITSTTLGDTMVSDAASTPEGSGSTETEFDFIAFTGTGTGSDFTESGSGESESTTESGATSISASETTSSDSTKDTGSTLTGETSTSISTVTESGTSVTAGTGSTDSATGTSTESTGETSTSGSTVTKDDSTTDSSGPTASESESSSEVSESASTSELGSTSETGSTTESGSTVAGETGTTSTGASDSTEVTSSDSSSIPPGSTVTDSSTSLGETTTSDSIGTTDADTGSTSDSTLTTPTEETTDPSSETTTDSTTDTPTTAATTDSSETTTDFTTTAKTNAADAPLTPSPKTTPSTPTVSSDSSTPTSDGSTLTTDGSTPTTDGSSPTLDGSSTTSDGLTPTSDDSTPTSDGSTLTLDGSTPTSDKSTPTSDGSTPTSDTSTPTSDGSTSSTDGSSPTSDGLTPTTDGSTPTSDGSTPTTDGSTPTTDGSTPSSDGSTPESGSTTEAGTGPTSTPASESSTSTGTGSTVEGGSTTDDGLDTSPWDASTIFSTNKPRCRPRNAKAKCATSRFGCCPDKRTAAGGPFDEGCPSPTTCKDTRYGCCPDGVSPAGGSNNEDCPVPKCGETLYGCCASDNKTPAEGNDQEGCPPPCKASKYGCCADNETQATGPHKAGCPETATTTTEPTTESTTESASTAESLSTEFTSTESSTEPVTSGLCSIVNGTEVCEPCSELEHGCCDDGETPAHGPDKLGCCLLSPHGCCPDNYQAATGPNHEGCSCTTSKFGCCPDNKSYARGANYSGCGCVYSAHGCCPDRHTEATGPNFEGCSCHTYQYGCCPDGETPAEGPNQEGCRCQGQNCCSDGVTAAKGPNQEGCDCSTSEFGCCLDGVTPAQSKNFSGCASAPVNKQAACALKYDVGNCTAYTVQWYYDMDYGGCSRFHYGGCGGNDNRFADKTECEAVCVKPEGKDVCHLPKVKGTCNEAQAHWYFDSDRQRCEQFIYGGCLGNGNNYKTREECETRCSVKLNQEQQCQQPLEKGPCNGNFARWGFEAGECREFSWGGCEGNSNRFISKAACDLQCNPPGEKRPECQLPQDSGNCTEKIPYWSFSKAEERCLPIYYSGCGGNNNRFTTQEHCEASCPSSFVKDKCTLPVNFGECRRLERRWFYDTKNQQCREFTYGGCNGNANNFYSEQQCNSECAVTKPPPRPPTPPTVAETPASCLLPTEPGTCFGSQLRWTYAVEILECIPFTYTGCGGNGNNFATKENCESVCRPPKDICTLPKVVGPCRVAQPRFYYNATTQRCERFYYGGCRGNANNFETEEECHSQCNKPATTPIPEPSNVISAECRVGDIGQCRGVGRVWYLDPGSARCAPYDSAAGAACDVPGVFPSPEACERSCGEFRGLGDVCRFNKEEGSCNDRQRKYYYDDASKSCQPFTYTGCYGSPNRFSSERECESVCMPDPCKMPVAMGNCTEQIDSWFYDESTDECGPFTYTGCNGNANRFESRGECEGQCKTGVPPLPAPITPTPEQTLLEEQCRLPAALQPCGAVQYAFYYDYNENSCIQAPIGGCTHIPNRYRTQEECLRKCGDFRGKDVCRERLDPGPCRDTQETKYYWNLSQGRCEPFTYGGCEGGANRFSTAEECFEVCGNLTIDPACGLPPAPGAACAGAGRTRGGTRWHHSSLYGDCRPFVFYGCEGNGNNFASREECERHCSPPVPGEGNEIECEEARRECSALRCEYGITYTKDPGDDCDRCSCDPNPCADMQCGPGQSCHIVPYRAGNNGDIKYTSQCRSDCSSERARCATLQQQCAVQRTRGPDNCERCECIRPEANCQAFEDECRTLQCSYGPVTRTRDADGCERCTCLAHPCEGTQCPEGQRCVVTADRNPLNGDVQYSGNCGTVNKPGSCPAEQAPSSSCHVECNDDADCRGVQKCCASGCSRLCRAPAPDRPTQLYPEPPSAPQPDPATEKAVSSSEGGTATLRCIFTSNPPVHITWKKDEITIDGKQGRYRLTSDGALQIVSLYRNDSGVYICIGENELGSSQQEVELRVDVRVKTSIRATQTALATGGRLDLVCDVDGYPEPRVYWTKDNQRLSETSTLLSVSPLAETDAGEYGCHADNGYSNHHSTVQITVQKLYIPELCKDNQYFADCKLIVRSHLCHHEYYSKFCCKSCVEAGELHPSDLEFQADQSWTFKKK